MARDFTIQIDSSNLNGSYNGNTVQLPFIRQVNSLPALKMQSSAYTVFVGDKIIGNENADQNKR